MTTQKTVNYGQTPVGDRASVVLFVAFPWDVTIQADADKVIVGQLPAGHRFIKKLSYVIADGSTGAMTYDLCLDADAQKICTAEAVVANTFKQTDAEITDALAYAIGVSDANRDFYFILPTAPTVAGGKLIAYVAYAPA